jgi:hypothetical protein
MVHNQKYTIEPVLNFCGVFIMYGSIVVARQKKKSLRTGPNQCCQRVYFQTKSPNVGKFCKALQ